MTTTATKKAAQKDPADEGVSAFTDITDAQEQAAKDAERPVEFDDEGQVKPHEPSAAALEVANEQAVRAAAQAEGGGPWPLEVLQNNYIEPGQRMRALQPEYTSHEDAE